MRSKVTGARALGDGRARGQGSLAGWWESSRGGVVGLTGGPPRERAPGPGSGGGQRGEQHQRRRGQHGGRREAGGRRRSDVALGPRGEGRWAPAPQERERGVGLQRSADSARRDAGGRDRVEQPASGPGPAPRAGRPPPQGSVTLLPPEGLGADL